MKPVNAFHFDGRVEFERAAVRMIICGALAGIAQSSTAGLDAPLPLWLLVVLVCSASALFDRKARRGSIVALGVLAPSVLFAFGTSSSWISWAGGTAGGLALLVSEHTVRNSASGRRDWGFAWVRSRAGVCCHWVLQSLGCSNRKLERARCRGSLTFPSSARRQRCSIHWEPSQAM